MCRYARRRRRAACSGHKRIRAVGQGLSNRLDSSTSLMPSTSVRWGPKVRPEGGTRGRTPGGLTSATRRMHAAWAKQHATVRPHDQHDRSGVFSVLVFLHAGVFDLIASAPKGGLRGGGGGGWRGWANLQRGGAGGGREVGPPPPPARAPELHAAVPSRARLASPAQPSPPRTCIVGVCPPHCARHGHQQHPAHGCMQPLQTHAQASQRLCAPDVSHSARA